MNIELLREYCLSLPGVTEDIKWGNDLCFCIHEKMFCVTGLNNPEFKVTLKVPAGDFDDLISTDGIISAPYVGRFKWILIEDTNRFSIKEWKFYIRQSYELIGNKSKKSTSLRKKKTK